jgi:hypothetical protein
MPNHLIERPKFPPPQWPPTVKINGRNYNWRSQIEHLKAQLVRHSAGLEPLPYPEARPEPDSLVATEQLTIEFGVSRKTLLRRWKAAGMTTWADAAE